MAMRLLGMALFVLILAGQLQAQISQIPLFLTSRVDPNLIFILDDSGSMQFEVTPDDYVFWDNHHGVPFVYPRADKVYGSSDYNNNAATVDNNSAYNALVRSSQYNKNYYNPAVTYRPWVKADGSSYPSADPSRAYHNPQNTGGGSRDLTANNREYAYWRDCNSAGSCSRNWGRVTYWPALYFYHNGGSIWTRSNYTRVEINSSVATYSGHGRQSRTDCKDAASGVCTYNEEIQNFANWYSYYRSRILAARAAIGHAFEEQSENMRVGFGSINTSDKTIDGTKTNTILTGVRPFAGTDRSTFYDLLYGLSIPAKGTPLRQALGDAGEYLMRKDNKGPWGNTPGADDKTPHLECRQCYTVLMTDGYWNNEPAGNSAARENTDNTDGPSHSGQGDIAYVYKALPPFKDSYSDTLADVAMYYWKTDLRPDLPNRVPTSIRNPAFWQHMVTYGVGFGVTGSIKPEDAWKAVETGATINWPDPTKSDAAKLDDLLHAAVNSRGGFFSAADPETFAKELSAVLQDIVNRGLGAAAAIAANSTRLSDSTYIYQARFYSTDWSGQMIAYKLDPVDGTIAGIQWNSDDEKIPHHSNRKIFTSAAGQKKGNYFTWDGLTKAQRDLLAGGDTTNSTVAQRGRDRLGWLRGNQDREVGKDGGYLRKRTRILGDIVNSDPVIVGAYTFRYQYLPADVPGRDSYLDFVEKHKTRRRVIYVGANDGMLHAFDAETGDEVFAYVPNSIYANLADLTTPDYDHRFYVNGTPYAGDVYINGEWKTVLIGTLGAGGRGVFALDVTDPDNFGPDKVLWDISSQDSDFGGLGYLITKPVVGRMQNGSWATVLSNGYGSGQGAKLYVVDIETGSRLAVIDTGTEAGNGLSVPASSQDANRTITAVYAGDLAGNLWKFDLSDTSVAKWEIPYKDKGKPAPLFVATDASKVAQPITAPVEIGLHSKEGYMIFFGTGKYFEVGDNVLPTNPQIQTFYGIWDDLKNNNRVAGRDQLVQQTILREEEESGDLWRFSTTFPESYFSSKRGWYLDLVSPEHGSQGERVVTVPHLRHGRVIFTTLIPSADPCSAGGSGWLMELDAATGNMLDYAVLDVNKDGKIDDKDTIIAGKFLGVGTTLGAFIGMGETEKKFGTEATGGVYIEREKTNPNAGFGRRSWRQLR